MDNHNQPVHLGRIQGFVAALDYLIDGNLNADMVRLVGDPGGTAGPQPYQEREITLRDLANGTR